MVKTKKPLLILTALALFFSAVSTASAASLFLSSKSENVSPGDKIEVSVRISSEDVGFNAAQATIQFPKDILEVSEIDRSSSVFNFWLQEPVFNNQEGSINFIGGSTSGYSGKSLQVFNIIFRVKGSGTANLIFNDGAVTASDGSGTNILSAMNGLRIESRPTEEIQRLIELARPVQITRPAEPALKLPAKPDTSIALYPDPARWYNLSFPFFAGWKLPADVNGVATALNRRSDFSPAESEGLFESERFLPLEDGVWYLHVRFRNDIGWGPVNHYRLAIDTAPPAAFSLSFAEGAVTDNPSPTVAYRSGDALSGLDRYEIKIDNDEPIKTLKTSHTLPLLPPGKRLIRVRAIDRADNVSETMAELEILPIASPAIASVNKDVFVGEGGLAISGTANPEFSVLLSLKHQSGRLVYSAELKPASDGNWDVKIEESLKKGKYFFEIVARDKRGALSLPVTSELIRVRERPLLVVAGFEITQGWFFTGLTLILLFGFGIGWFSYRLWHERIKRKIVIAQRDVANAFGIIKRDLDDISGRLADKKIDSREINEIEVHLKRIGVNMAKMQKYIIENIEEIKE